MSLRLSLLCLLTARPMTGYELAKQFDSSVAYVWHAPQSQIYPELRRLEEKGLVEAQSLPRGGKAVKRAYQITEAGRAEIERWIRELADPAPLRDADHLKASYLEFGSFENARSQFRAHRERHERERAIYENHMRRLANRETELMRDRLATFPPETHEMIAAYKVHVYRGLARRAALEVEWADEGLELVDRLAAMTAQDSTAART